MTCGDIRFLKCVVITVGTLMSTHLLTYSVNGFLIADLFDVTKIITNPAAQIGSTILDVSCKAMKDLLHLKYRQMIQWNNKPDVFKLDLCLITADNMEYHAISKADRTVLKSKHYDNAKKLVIIMHGFFTDPRGSSSMDIARALYHTGEYNVLAVDSSALIRFFYTRATTYVRFIGKKVGKLLVKFVKAGVPLKDITLVGHSLGAHVAGFAGMTYFRKTGKKVPRILALDPASICYDNIHGKFDINRDNADIVDVIHTNGGGFGLMDPVGHRDFYPNGGQTQRGCLGIICDHSRSWQFVAESIEDSEAFLAKRCSSWIQFVENSCHGTSVTAMGFEIDENAPDGTYYLWTGSSYPLGLGKYGLKSEPFF